LSDRAIGQNKAVTLIKQAQNTAKPGLLAPEQRSERSTTGFFNTLIGF
jgi:hypothetical protein